MFHVISERAPLLYFECVVWFYQSSAVLICRCLCFVCLFCLFLFDLVWFLILLFSFCSSCCCGGGGGGGGCFASLLAFRAEYKLWGSNRLKLFGWLAAKNAVLTGLTWSCPDEVTWNHTEEAECLRLTETLSQTEHCRYWWKWLPYNYHEQRDANDFYHFVSYQWRVTRQ